MNSVWQGQPRTWAGLILLVVVGAGLGVLLMQAVVPARYTSTELVRLYNKEDEKKPYAPVLSVDDIFKRNAQLDSLITPQRLREAISLVPEQYPQLKLTAAQIGPKVQTQVVRDTPFIEIKAEAASKEAAQYLAGGVAANLLMLQIERHEPLNLRMETTTQVSTHILAPTEIYFALPLALVVALILAGLAARAILIPNNFWATTLKIPLVLNVAIFGIVGLAMGIGAALLFPLAFLMLALIGLVAVLALVRFEWGLFGLLALLPFHNLFRAFVDSTPWSIVKVLDYWQQGLLLWVLATMLWQLRRTFLNAALWRNPLRVWQSWWLHEKILAVFGVLGVIYVFVAPKLVVGLSGLVEDFACFGVYLVARQVGKKPMVYRLQSTANGSKDLSSNVTHSTTMRSSLNPIAWLLVAGGVVAIITVFQYLGTGTAAYLIWTGSAVGSPDFNTLTANYLYGTVDTKPVYRAVSTLMNPLSLAFYAVTMSALALTLFVFWRKRSHKLWALAVGVGLINALLLSYTRSVWIGAGLAVLLLIGLALFKRLRPTSWQNLLLYGLIIAAVMACDFIPWNTLVGSFGDNPLGATGGLFGSLSSYTSATLKGQDGTSNYHINSLLDVGVNQLLLKHPLGAGMGMEGTVANHYIADGTIKNPLPWVESYYFVIAGELGILGLLLFLALLATSAWDLLSQWRQGSVANQLWLVGLSVAGLAMLVGVAVSSVTLPSWSDGAVAWTLWGVIGLAFSPAARATRPEFSAITETELHAVSPLVSTVSTINMKV